MKTNVENNNYYIIMVVNIYLNFVSLQSSNEKNNIYIVIGLFAICRRKI